MYCSGGSFHKGCISQSYVSILHLYIPFDNISLTWGELIIEVCGDYTPITLGVYYNRFVAHALFTYFLCNLLY